MENLEETLKKQRLSKKDIDEFTVEQYEKCRSMLDKLEDLGENSKYDNQKATAIKAYFACVERMQKIMQAAVESDLRLKKLEEGDSVDGIDAEDDEDDKEVKIEFGT